MTTSAPQRVRISFGLALILHALVLSSYLPEMIEYAQEAVRKAFPPPEPPPPPERQIIPVNLPARNLQLQFQLGSVKHPPKDQVKPEQLPKFQPKLAMQLSISPTLGDAADQAQRAQAASQRMAAQARVQKRVEETFVADIVLLESPLIAVPAPAPALALGDQQRLAELAIATAPPSSAAPEVKVQSPTPKKPAAEPPAPAPARSPPASASRPTPERPPPPKPVKEDPTANLPIPDVAQPAPPPAQIPPAREEQPLAALFIPGMEPAPDRGPGEVTAGAAVYFSKLTAHLFRANQQALANSVRVSGKMTLDVRFYVDRSGRILGAQVVRSSGDTALDQRAEQIILDASPVPRLAEDMPQRRLELSFPVDVYR